MEIYQQVYQQGQAYRNEEFDLAFYNILDKQLKQAYLVGYQF